VTVQREGRPVTYQDVATSLPTRERAVPGPPAPDDDFERFFRGSYDRLVRALVPTTRSVDAAEELVQEAMARAYDRWARVSTMESPTGYVYATAVNLHRRQFRRRLMHLRTQERPAVAQDPADLAMARADLLAAVGRLPREQRDAVMLVDWLGLDSATAGRLLGIEASSVRARTHRARHTLERAIER
jgi:RNA polymerase sigma factor (sigma-70 family)